MIIGSQEGVTWESDYYFYKSGIKGHRANKRLKKYDNESSDQSDPPTNYFPRPGCSRNLKMLLKSTQKNLPFPKTEGGTSGIDSLQTTLYT